MKICTKCGETKSKSLFPKAVANRGGLRPECKTCFNRYQRAVYAQHIEQQKARSHRRFASHPHERRARTLQQKYGISPAYYAEMVQLQQGLCAVCRQPEQAKSQRGRTMQLAVDHDHTTGAVRGLLCNSCNRGIGLFGDDKTRILIAADYLNGGGSWAEDYAV
jgi:hypothetical protein